MKKVATDAEMTMAIIENHHLTAKITRHPRSRKIAIIEMNMGLYTVHQRFDKEEKLCYVKAELKKN